MKLNYFHISWISPDRVNIFKKHILPRALYPAARHTRAWVQGLKHRYPDFAAPLLEKELRDHDKHLKKLLGWIHKGLVLLQKNS